MHLVWNGGKGAGWEYQNKLGRNIKLETVRKAIRDRRDMLRERIREGSLAPKIAVPVQTAAPVPTPIKGCSKATFETRLSRVKEGFRGLRTVECQKKQRDEFLTGMLRFDTLPVATHSIFETVNLKTDSDIVCVENRKFQNFFAHVVGKESLYEVLADVCKYVKMAEWDATVLIYLREFADAIGYDPSNRLLDYCPFEGDNHRHVKTVYMYVLDRLKGSTIENTVQNILSGEECPVKERDSRFTKDFFVNFLVWCSVHFGDDLMMKWKKMAGMSSKHYMILPTSGEDLSVQYTNVAFISACDLFELDHWSNMLDRMHVRASTHAAACGAASKWHAGCARCTKVIARPYSACLAGTCTQAHYGVQRETIYT